MIITMKINSVGLLFCRATNSHLRKLAKCRREPHVSNRRLGLRTSSLAVVAFDSESGNIRKLLTLAFGRMKDFVPL
jgi:hypothetical protein